MMTSLSVGGSMRQTSLPPFSYRTVPWVTSASWSAAQCLVCLNCADKRRVRWSDSRSLLSSPGSGSAARAGMTHKINRAHGRGSADTMEIKIPRDQSLEPSEVSVRPQQGRGQPAISQVLLSIAFWIWVGGSGIVLALAALVLFIPFNPLIDRQRRVMDWISHLWGKAIMTALPGVRLEVLGRDRLHTWNEPFVFCANHQSVADIPVLLSIFPHFKFVVKESLFWLFPIGLQ